MRITLPLKTQITANINSYIQRAVNGLDYAAYGHLIQHCTNHRLLRQGKQLHARIVLLSVIPQNFLAAKLIALYSKSNLLTEAFKVFDEIPDKNTFSWNAMLIAYSLHNKHLDTLDLFSALMSSSYAADVKPDNFSITCVLKALSSLFPESNLGKEIHCFVLRNAFDSDIFVVNSLITYYSRCDDLNSAKILFEKLPERDVVSWNAMIAGYSQAGYYENCLRLYKEMVNSSHLKPDALTVISVLQACAQVKDLVSGMEVHSYIMDAKIKMDLAVLNSIIGLYSKCGSLDYARELFVSMNEKDEITYGSIISGYMIHGFIDDAMNLFREMKLKGLSTWNAVISGLVQNNQHEEIPKLLQEMQHLGFRPNPVTLSSVLTSFSYFSNLKGAKQIHCYAIRNSYIQNIYVATAVIDTYAKSGLLQGARRVFGQSRDRSVITWTAVISAYAAHGDANSALSLFEEMINSGTCPDSVTFTAVLSGCAHSGAIDEALRIFDSMLKKHRIMPSVEHYACMVGVLSRAGMLSKAVELISRMPIEPSARVWGALLNGASVFGDIELGEFVCDYLFEIEPENTGNYIILANLYSRAGRFEEAEKVRKKMMHIGLKKLPGSSWIETKQGLRSFAARDVLSERSEEIYGILEGLVGLMREEGYVLRDELDEESLFVVDF